MHSKKLGFIGLGNMGGRMTRCLVDSGIEVVGFDPQPGAAKKAGAREAQDIGQIVDECELIMMSLPDSKVVENVMLQQGGILSHCRSGQVIVDLSTASAASTLRLHSLLQEKSVAYVDVGISGGAAAAEKGQLTLMVGGEESVIQGIEWAFSPIASKVVVMGGSSAGHTTKLLNNFLNAVSLAATAEVMVAGKKAGLDLQRLLDVFNSSSGVNFATINRFPSIIQGDYLEGGLTGKLMTKDLVLYADLLHQLGMTSLNSAGPLASFGLATALGYGDVISNRVVDAIGDISGGIRLYSSDN